MNIPEPMLTTELEETAGQEDTDNVLWCASVLRELARQLGFANDYYYPLLTGSQMLEAAAKDIPA